MKVKLSPLIESVFLYVIQSNLLRLKAMTNKYAEQEFRRAAQNFMGIELDWRVTLVFVTLDGIKSARVTAI